ncbi:hypothetical protein Syun_008775 [Stephania yunnanensis]|uniref:Uncharacterized protein n=1 Tax=Stephania yunnanensis TaxID=152371 RepID=A0AAP0KD84_9MAGN
MLCSLSLSLSTFSLAGHRSLSLFEPFSLRRSPLCLFSFAFSPSLSPVTARLLSRPVTALPSLSPGGPRCVLFAVSRRFDLSLSRISSIRLGSGFSSVLHSLGKSRLVISMCFGAPTALVKYVKPKTHLPLPFSAQTTRNLLNRRRTIVATTVAIVDHCNRCRRPRLRCLSPSSASHADALDTTGHSAAVHSLPAPRCSPLSAAVASLSPPPLSSRNFSCYSHADAIDLSVALPLLSLSVVVAPHRRRLFFHSPLRPPRLFSAAATRLILDSVASLLIRDSSARTPTLPSAKLHPGGLARRHNRLVDCLATRRWTFESQS